MAANEGFRRIYLIGKAILAFGVLLDLILIGGIVAAAFGGNEQLIDIGMIGVPPTMLGLAILAVTWIAEGFLHGRSSAHRGDAQPTDMLR